MECRYFKPMYFANNLINRQWKGSCPLAAPDDGILLAQRPGLAVHGQFFLTASHGVANHRIGFDCAVVLTIDAQPALPDFENVAIDLVPAIIAAEAYLAAGFGSGSRAVRGRSRRIGFSHERVCRTKQANGRGKCRNGTHRVFNAASIPRHRGAALRLPSDQRVPLVVPDDVLPVEPEVSELLDVPVEPVDDGELEVEPEEDPMPEEEPEDDPMPEDESEDDEPLELGEVVLLPEDG